MASITQQARITHEYTDKITDALRGGALNGFELRVIPDKRKGYFKASLVPAGKATGKLVLAEPQVMALNKRCRMLPTKEDAKSYVYNALNCAVKYAINGQN